MHNQNEAADRLQYLEVKFRKMPLKQEGISKTHDSILNLLLGLANCPTGEDGYNTRKLGNRTYFTKVEAEKLHQVHVEDQIRTLWEAGLLPERAGLSDVEDDSSQGELGYSDEEIGEALDVQGCEQQKIIKFDPIIKNRQAFFGGMPMTAQVTKLTEIVTEVPLVKKFNTDQFLDSFFKESAIQEKGSLRQELGLPTRAEIQYSLSRRGGNDGATGFYTEPCNQLTSNLLGLTPQPL